MPDIATIGALISSVKSATDIAKFIKDSDLSLTTAESKLKAAELISALADVKFELADVQDLLRERDERILTLEKELAIKLDLTFDGKYYWAEGDKVPFCAVCRERDNKNHHLTYFPPFDSQSSGYQHCKVCDNSFD